MRPGFKGYAWLLLVMVFWGAAFPASKWAVGQVPHDVAALLRFGGGTLILLVALAVLRPKGRPRGRDLLVAGLAGLIGVFAYNALFFWGVSMAPASDGSVIIPAMAPVFTTTMLVLTGRDSARPARVLGLVLGFGGAVGFFLATGTHVSAGSNRLLGDAIYVAGAAVWAAYTILSRSVLADVEPLVATTAATLCGSLALGLIALPTIPNIDWTGLSDGFWLNMVFLAVAPTAVAYLLYARGIRDLGAGTASAMMFTVPVFGTVFAFAFLGESFNTGQAVAALGMVAGAYLAVVSGPRAEQPDSAPSVAIT